MKLKYYLRGLAVGVILTTIILSIANAGNKPLTDTEIRKRALELGMVEGDSRKLSDVAESSGDESSESYNPSIYEVESTAETGNSEESSETSDNTEVSLEKTTSIESETGSQTTSSETADGAGSPSMPPASVETTGSAENTESTEPITFTIKSGDSSYTVSKALAAVGLVEDAVEFDDYLCDNGYSRTIRTGTYEILPGATYEEIAKKIAR